MSEKLDNSGRGVAVNSALLMGASIVTNAMLLCIDLSVIGGYGAAAHAEVTLVLSVAMIGAILCDAGLASKAGVRTIASLRAADPARLARVTGVLLTTLIGLALLGGVATAVFADAIGGGLGVSRHAVVQAAIWLFSIAGIRAFFMVFMGFERVVWAALVLASIEASRLIWTGVCVVFGLRVEALYAGWSAIWVGLFVVSAVVAFGLLRRRAGGVVLWPIDLGGVALALRGAAAYFVPALSNYAFAPLCFFLAGFAMVRVGDDAARVSLLKVCFSLALIMRVASQAMATSLFPFVARSHAADSAGGEVSVSRRGRPVSRRSFDAVLLDSVRVMAFVATGLMAVAVAAGPSGLALLDDRLAPGDVRYASGHATLIVLIVAMAIACYRVQIDQVLMGTGRVRVVTIGESAVVLLLIALVPGGVFLLPMQADLSAAWGVLLAVGLATVHRYYAARQSIGAVGGGLALRGLLLIALLAGLSLWDGASWFALPVWGGCALSMGLVRRSDWRRVRGLLLPGR